jgi:SMP-30/Gluconolactonase/LRE-like region
MRAYDVVGDGTRLANGRVFIRMENGKADGLRLDVDGNLWCGWDGGGGRDGVMIINKGGVPIGHIDLPERCANVCFGGYRRSRRSWWRVGRSMRCGSAPPARREGEMPARPPANMLFAEQPSGEFLVMKRRELS